MYINSIQKYCKTLTIADDIIINYFNDITVGKNKVYELKTNIINNVLKIQLDEYYNDICFMRYVCSAGFKEYYSMTDVDYLYTVIDRKCIPNIKDYKWHHDFRINKIKDNTKPGIEYFLTSSYVIRDKVESDNNPSINKPIPNKLHRYVKTDYGRIQNIQDVHHIRHTFDNRFDMLANLNKSSHYKRHHPATINEHSHYMCNIKELGELRILLADL